MSKTWLKRPRASHEATHRPRSTSSASVNWRVQAAPEVVVHAQMVGGVALGELGGQALASRERVPPVGDHGVVERIGHGVRVLAPGRDVAGRPPAQAERALVDAGDGDASGLELAEGEGRALVDGARVGGGRTAQGAEPDRPRRGPAGHAPPGTTTRGIRTAVGTAASAAAHRTWRPRAPARAVARHACVAAGSRRTTRPASPVTNCSHWRSPMSHSQSSRRIGRHLVDEVLAAHAVGLEGRLPRASRATGRGRRRRRSRRANRVLRGACRGGSTLTSSGSSGSSRRGPPSTSTTVMASTLSR